MATVGDSADIGYDISVSWNSNTYYLISLEGPNVEVDAVETTHSKSTDSWKTFIPGLRDGGEVTMELNFEPDEPVEADITVRTLTITFPPSTGQTNGATATASAFVQSAGQTVPIEDRMTQSVTFKLTGAVTWANGS